MSRNNASRSYQVQALVKQIEEADENDRYSLHGIEVDEDGSVFDSCYGKTFASIHKWAEFNIDMEELESEPQGSYGALDD
jgi:hypothetical protein